MSNPSSDARQLVDDPRWKHVCAARWFGGKGRGGVPLSIAPLTWFNPPQADGPAVRSEIVTVGYPEGGVEYYQLLISYRDHELPDCLIGPSPEAGLGFMHDASGDHEALELIVEALKRNATGLTGDALDSDPAQTGLITADPTTNQADDTTVAAWTSTMSSTGWIDQPLHARRFGGEQSNTSVFLGSQGLLKFFRRLEIGRNIDIELHEALALAGVPNVDEIYGWAFGTVVGPHGTIGPADILMMTQQLPEPQEGWLLATEAAKTGSDFTEQASALGTALGRVHEALSSQLGTGTISGDELAQTMTDRLDAAIQIAPALGPHRDGLTQIFESLRGKDLATQRIHGDFHLGQTLLSQGTWYILDFEGEPMKTMTERRTPDSIWRDVAGMVRSFGYAAFFDGNSSDPDRIQWNETTTQAFLSAYLGVSYNPEGTDTLNAYVADKAVYEVVYETRNRPDWVPIPMSAIETLTRRGGEA